MGRVYFIVAIAAMLLAVGYGLGTFAESYSLNQCYALALGTLARKGEDVAASRSDAALDRFRRLVRSLPLEGPRTRCKRVELAVQVPDDSG